MCLTLYIYPLTPPGHTLTWKSLNVQVCSMSIVRRENLCHLPVMQSHKKARQSPEYNYICNIWIVSFFFFYVDRRKNVDIGFILSELHATDRGFKPVIGLSPRVWSLSPHPRHSPYSPSMLCPCCWEL